MMKNLFSVCFLFFSAASFAQGEIDVQHYQYDIALSDESDVVNGTATITIKFPKSLSQFALDFGSDEGGKGMQAAGVFENGLPIQFSHQNDVLLIQTKAIAGETKTVVIQFTGSPKDGLIISKNKYGDRTFFADNWPNRAHYWIPCNDKPDDKATFEFSVTAPVQYKIVSNGKLMEEIAVSNSQKRTHWKTDIALPTKVMVIGAAKFAVKQYADSPKNIPVTAWIYQQDSSKGFSDYATAPEILKFFSNYIAPYPFEKLANVQSKTMFGGMENASAIFYNETSVTGNGGVEDLLAHEIVHQWFGDMASEKSFTHLWLSEGFATYLTNIYLEQKYGKEMLKKRMAEDREQVIEFAKSSKQAVVDSTTPFMELLNANSYQKGGWVLHMLRNEVGDSVFQKIIQVYYTQYKGSNADTRDFEAIAEKVSGKELSWFFDQWLYQVGIPQLDCRIKLDKDNNEILCITQKQKTAFRIPIEIYVSNGKDVILKTVQLDNIETHVKIPNNYKRIEIDPKVKLLYTGTRAIGE